MGEWHEVNDPGICPECFWRCDACGMPQFVSEVQILGFRFCPSCGARMTGLRDWLYRMGEKTENGGDASDG